MVPCFYDGDAIRSERILMNNTKRLMLFICVITIGLSGCSKDIDFTEEGPFIILTSYPGGENYYVDFYPRNIAVHEDGTLHIYTEATEDIIVEDDAPTVEIKLTNKEVQHIKETIQDNRFFRLPKDVSDPHVMDGPMQYITVHADTESKEVGGEWPVNENFQAIRKEVLDHVQKEYDDWLDEIDDYIYEKNPSSS